MNHLPAAKKHIDTQTEWYRCQASVIYFINEYCSIYSAPHGKWIPFKLWPVQVQVVRDIITHKFIVIIKARQFGFSWICRAIFLHAAIYEPSINAVMFSKSQEDAKKLLSDEKGMKGMYKRIPAWMKPEGANIKYNSQQLTLANGSNIEARPYTQAEGDSWSHALFDEFDRYPFGNDQTLFDNVDPAIENARMTIMGSISDKTRPNSLLKNTYRAAKNGESKYHPIFIPYSARPDRNYEWWQLKLRQKVAEMDDEAGALDWMYQQYPREDTEAMAPATRNKRIPYNHLQRVYEEATPLEDPLDAPALPKLKIYREPEPDRNYVIGGDPAEGVPGGDDSAADILDADTGEQVATLRGKFEPKKVFPSYVFQLAVYYNDAGILIERNNHGWGVLGELPELIAGIPGCKVEILDMPQDDKPGWLSSTRGKTLLYDECARQIKDEEVTIHDKTTVDQMQDIGINSLRATDGKHDDAADSFALACVARTIPSRTLSGQLFY